MATMSTRFIIAGLASMASASIIPRMGEQECCFGISASGPVAGPLGQLGVSRTALDILDEQC